MTDEEDAGYFFFQGPWKNIFLWHFMDVEREAFLATTVMDMDLLRKLQSILIARADRRLRLRVLLRFNEEDILNRDVDPETLRILALLLDEPNSKIEVRFLANLSMTAILMDGKKAILATGDLSTSSMTEDLVFGQLMIGREAVSDLEEDLNALWESAPKISQQGIVSYMEALRERLLIRSAATLKSERQGISFKDNDRLSLGSKVPPPGKDRAEPHLDEAKKITRELLIRARDAADKSKLTAAMFYLDEGLALDPDNPELLLEKGKFLFQERKDPQAAIACFDKVLDQDENNRDAWALSGMCHHEMGALDEALYAYDQATDIDPQHYPVWIKKGTILGKKQGREKDGVKCLEFALSQDPYNEEAWFNKAAILEQRLDMMDEAVLAYRTLLRINPQHVKGAFRMGLISYKKLNNPAKAKQYLGKVLEADPAHVQAAVFMSEIAERVDRDFDAAFAHLDSAAQAASPTQELLHKEIELLLRLKKRFGRALELSGTLLELNPKDALALYVSGLGALRRDQDPSKALELMNESIRSDPNFKLALISKANILAEHLGRVQDAITLLRTALKRAQEDHELWMELGTIYFDFLYDPKEAIQCFDQVIKLDPKGTNGWYNKGLVLSRGFEKHQEALKSLDEATRLDDSNSMAWYEKGRILSKVFNMTEDALKCYRKSLTLVPDDHEVLTSTAALLRSKNDVQGAIQHYQRAIEVDPCQMDPYLCISDIYMKTGDLAAVHRTLGGALQADPRNDKVWLMKGDAFRQQNELGKALECYKRVLMANPENQDGLDRKTSIEAQLEKAASR